MGICKTIMASAIAVAAATVSAQAATLSGIFDVRVVNYSFGSNQSSSVSTANQANFDARFGVPVRQVTRDGIEATVARRLGDGLRVYGGADLNFHANPGVERTAARWGAEWDPGPTGGSEASTGVETWPFAAADFQVTSLAERVATTAAAGMGVRVSGVVLRLEVRGHWGPSPMGRFRTVDESFLGLGLRVVP